MARRQIYNGRAVLSLLRDKLSRTRQALWQKLSHLKGETKSKEETLTELAEALILADVGLTTTEKIMANLKKKPINKSPTDLVESLKEELLEIIGRKAAPLNVNCSPSVVMLVGANGGGKTTSLAKLAYRLKKEGRQVILVAADTFRAAAQEQLQIWSRQLDLPLVRGHYGADPAAVVFDAIQAMKSRQADALLIDTAGRVHTNTNLMAELEKIRRIIAREISGAPHEILLVLDASIGQNALSQAREYLKFSGLTGIFLTKLDGTAKGGAVVAIASELGLPIKLIGIGESAEDLLPFSAEEFVSALLS